MTQAHIKNDLFPITNKREIDWAQYLDFTRFIETAENENEQLAKFRNDFNF